jgi:hypothetical protein
MFLRVAPSAQYREISLSLWHGYGTTPTWLAELSNSFLDSPAPFAPPVLTGQPASFLVRVMVSVIMIWRASALSARHADTAVAACFVALRLLSSDAEFAGDSSSSPTERNAGFDEPVGDDAHTGRLVRYTRPSTSELERPGGRGDS